MRVSALYMGVLAKSRAPSFPFISFLLGPRERSPGATFFEPMRFQLKTKPTRRQAREALSETAAIRAVYWAERGRRGRARTGHAVVVR